MNQFIFLQSVIVLFLTIGPLVFLKRSAPFISMRTGASLMLAMLFGLWPISYMFNPLVSGGYISIWGLDAEQFFSEALWYAIVGILCFQISYLLPIGNGIAKWFTPRRRVWSRKRILAFAFVATLASLLSAAAAWYQVGGLSNVMLFFGRVKVALDGYHYLTLGVHFLRAAILVAWAYSILSRRFPRWIIWGQVALYTAIMVALGGRNQIVGLWLSMFIMQLLLSPSTLEYFRGMSKTRILSTGLLVIGFSVLLLIVVRGFRTSYDTSTTGLGLAILQNIGESLTTFVTSIMREFDQMEVFATVIGITPIQIPFWNGQSYLDLLTLPVPRSLWPDKPIPARLILGQLIRGHDIGIPVTMIGEFYINFGIFGIVTGMSLFGVLCRSLDRWAYMFRDYPTVIIFYAFMLSNTPIILTRYFYGWFAALLLFMITLWVVVGLTTRKGSASVH